MTIALTFFILSFLSIVILVGHKLFEMHRRETALSKFRGKVDMVVEENLLVMKESHARHFEKGSVKKFFSVFFLSVLEAVVHIRRSLSQKWENFFHSLKTSAIKKSNGQVSLFLKDISREKKSFSGMRK